MQTEFEEVFYAESLDLECLKELVDEKFKEGFGPYGELIVVKSYDSDFTSSTFVQPLIKVKPFAQPAQQEFEENKDV